MTTETQTRRCIGSTRFGIEAHDADAGDFPVQPSQKDGLGRMCKPHWRELHERPAQGRGGAEGGGGDAELRAQSPSPRSRDSDEAPEPETPAPPKTRRAKAESDGGGRRRVATSRPHDGPRARVRGLLSSGRGQDATRRVSGAVGGRLAPTAQHLPEPARHLAAEHGDTIWTSLRAGLIMPRQYGRTDAA